MHLYIVVDCKTQDCRTVHLLMHLGEKGNTPAKVESSMSHPLLVDCPTCGKTYDHSDSEEKFWQKSCCRPDVAKVKEAIKKEAMKTCPGTDQG
jgi:hypothetical protein